MASQPSARNAAWGISVHARRPVHLVLMAFAGVALAGTAWAQGAKSPPQPQPNWNQTVTKEADASGQEFDAKQMDLIQKVTNYFNQMGDMKGNFVQVSVILGQIRPKLAQQRDAFGTRQHSERVNRHFGPTFPTRTPAGDKDAAAAVNACHTIV